MGELHGSITATYTADQSDRAGVLVANPNGSHCKNSCGHLQELQEGFIIKASGFTSTLQRFTARPTSLGTRAGAMPRAW